MEPGEYQPLVTGTPQRTGAWCTSCALPTVSELPVFALQCFGVKQLTVIRVCEACMTCPEETG